MFALIAFIIIIPKQKYVIGNSPIHGKGVICMHTIKKDESIGIVITRENNTTIITPYLGQYVNHKGDDNTYLKKVEENNIDTYYLHAKKNIYFGSAQSGVSDALIAIIKTSNLNEKVSTFTA